MSVPVCCVSPFELRRVIVSHFTCDNKNVVFHILPGINFGDSGVPGFSGRWMAGYFQKNRKNKMRTGIVLFHVNCFWRADVYAGLAVHAHILVDFCLLILQGNCRCRTFIHAGFASGTFLFVNDCYQLVHSNVYVSAKRKKGFLLRPTSIIEIV